MSIIPSRNKVTIIEGEDNDLSQWPVNQVPFKAADGTIQGSGLRMLSSGSLLAPVGFAVESGSIDFGDVLRLSESAGFLAFDNMVDQERYQLLDYAVPRDAPSSKPYYFKLIEAERKALNTDGDSVITTNPISFEYRTVLTARTNSITFKATAPMTNVRLRITDKNSGVAVKYFPSKSAWVDGVGGTRFEVGDNALDFQDTSVIFQANTDIIFDIQADNISLSATNGMPKFSAMVQGGVFLGVADATDLTDIQTQIDDLSGGFSVDYSDLTGIPATFAPSEHQHPTSDIEGLDDTILSLFDAIETVSGNLEELALVASSGSYNDLVDKPSIPVLNYPVLSVNSKTGNINLTATDVGAIGVGQGIDYAQITNAPTIPIVPTNTSQLVNDSGYLTEVVIPVQSVNGKTGSVVLTSTDVGAASLAHSHPISDIAGLQTSLDSKATAASLTDYATNISVSNGLSLKLNTPTGNTTDYIRGDGSITAFPAIPIASVNGKTGAVTLNNTDVGASAFGHTHVISEVNGLQAALDSKAPNSALTSYATTSALTSGLSAKFNIPTGITSQYIRGDGSLSAFPSIPAAQVNSDWTSTSGISQILNKPVLFDGTWNNLTGKPTTFTPSAHTHVISDTTGLQAALDAKASTASLANYATTASLSGYATTATLTNALVGMRKVETFLGISDASGNYTITFANTYTTPPDVQPQLIGATFNQMVRVVSVSNTGCVINAAQRNLVTLLSIEVLLGATVVLAGASISVQVTPRN